MARFTTAQREEILAEARANLKRAPDVQTRASPDIVYKTHVNDADERTTAQPWCEWIDDRLAATVEGIGQAVGEMHDLALRQIATLKRELDQTRQELTVLRDQVGLERGLRDLREQVDQARAEVPKVPAIAARLEAQNARLRREVATTKNKVSRLRADQSIADYRLAELSKATAARAAVLETKIETSFTMREVHPEARTALRDFATEVLKGKTIWCFDPGSAAAGTTA
jgi:chromosome segregation ATPase